MIRQIDPTEGYGSWEYEFSSETSQDTGEIVPLNDRYLITYGNELLLIETQRAEQSPTDTISTEGTTPGSETTTGGGRENGNAPNGVDSVG